VTSIRPGRDGDAAGYIDLISACWGEYPGANTDVLAEAPEVAALASYIAAKEGALWTAEDDGRVVGMVATYPDGDAWHLSRMYVAADYRGTGLGAALLRGAEDHARAAGATRMVLWSDVLFARAHAFYENHSYVRRGGLRPLPGVPDVIEAGYAKPLTGRVVEELDIAAAESAERKLARLLQDCAAAGQPVGLLPPLGRDRARAYWKEVTVSVGRGTARLFVAWRHGEIAGAVQLVPDPAEDGRHRADIRMLLVAPGSKCQGMARALLQAAEAAASEAGRSLLLWQVAADTHASGYYRGWGFERAGQVPGYWRGGHGDLHLYVKTLETCLGAERT
jgi:ribosomal protein S18 acetylase RimI-like enzyme